MKNLFYLILFISNLSFGQVVPTFKCCNEYNTHKPSCKNFNRIQVWKIVLDSVVVRNSGGVRDDIPSRKNTILNTAEVIKFKLDRKDSTFTITALSNNNTNVEGILTMKYLTCCGLMDVDGEEMLEQGITLMFGDQFVSFTDYSWSANQLNAETPINLQFDFFSIGFYGEVEIIDK